MLSFIDLMGILICTANQVSTLCIRHAFGIILDDRGDAEKASHLFKQHSSEIFSKLDGNEMNAFRDSYLYDYACMVHNYKPHHLQLAQKVIRSLIMFK